MKSRLWIIIGMILLPVTIGSVYAECSEHDRDACIGSDGKFDYDAYEDSFWEPVIVQHSFEKNSTATFEHKKEGLGLRGTFTATQEDVVTITVPRNIVDAIHRNCDPDEIMLLAKYTTRYENTTAYDGFYQESFLADQIMNQTHRVVTLKVLPTMSFEIIGSFPLGLGGEMHDTCGALNGYMTYYAPPKFQLEHDVDPKLIKCNENLVLVQKNNDTSACVKPESVPKLIERNWILTENMTSESSRLCIEVPDVGLCKASIEKYYFDSETNSCKSFTWGGCGGIVPFDTMELCENLCN
jgi:hypothetical protein